MRKIIAAVLGTFATFVILFGFGMGNNWPIVALGVALLVLAISVVAVTAIRGGARAWVAGIAHVHTVSEPPASSRFGRCELQIVIDAPGLPPRSVKVRDPRVPVNKWPGEGATLPIMVAIDDQRHVRILWDDVLTHTEARQEAARAAGGLPPQHADPDPVTDDVLIGRQAPPWTQRDPDDDFLPPAEDLLAPSDPAATTADLSDDPIGLREQPRQPPGKGVVLEGTLVEPPNADAPSVPLPRRPRPSPHGTRRDPPPSAGAAPGAGPADPDDATAPRTDRPDTSGPDNSDG